jgi:uncharacterized protein (TIGR02271 family)
MSQTPEEQSNIIRRIEEKLIIDKQIVETGKVNVHKKVNEEIVSVNLPILNESYDVTRSAGSDEILETPPAAIRREGDRIIIPVLKEITVVQKRYQVVEEIVLTRKVTETPLTQEVTLRKEEVEIKHEQY